jgi:predicted DNA repair protein MutK
MFLVGGGILTHGVPVLHHGIEAALPSAASHWPLGGLWQALAPALLNALRGHRGGRGRAGRRNVAVKRLRGRSGTT